MLSRIKMWCLVVQMMISVSLVIILMYIFRKHTIIIRRFWGIFQLKFMGIKVDIEGVADNNADMIAINHQSIVDIIVLESLYPRDLAWVSKKEVADIPWFGHVLKAPKMIIIERESKTSLLKLLKEANENYKIKRPIAIFPEGTRTDGSKLRKFKVGAKMMAQKNDLKVQPVLIVGTRDVLDASKMTQTSGTIKLIYLPTIQSKKHTTWYEDMEANMAQVYLEKLNKQ